MKTPGSHAIPLFIVCALACLGQNTARATVISFDPALHQAGGSWYGLASPSYTASGFTLTAASVFCAMQDPSPGTSVSWAGATGLFNCVPNGLTTLTQVGGGAFNLDSIDMAPCNCGSGYGAPIVSFHGTRMDGTTVDSPAFAVPNVMQFATYSFAGMGFVNLQSVTWYHYAPYEQFDNITLDTAPEPSSALLLAAGLAAALLLLPKRDRRTKQAVGTRAPAPRVFTSESV